MDNITERDFIKENIGLILFLHEKYGITDINYVKQLLKDGTIRYIKVKKHNIEM